MKRSTVNILAAYIDALHPIIYINHFDFKVIDDAIAQVGAGVKCVEFNNALGIVDFSNKSPMEDCDLEQFLKLTNPGDRYQRGSYDVYKKADDVIIVGNHPSRAAFFKRNEWMVDNSRRLIAVYTGAPGGTKATIQYAEKHGSEIVLIDRK